MQTAIDGGSQHLKKGRRHESRYGASAHWWKTGSPARMWARSFDYNFAPLKLASGEARAGNRGEGFIYNYVCIFVSVQTYSAWDTKAL